MSILEQTLSLIAPHCCYICKQPGSLLCDACIEDYCPPTAQRCYRCHGANDSSAVCDSCRLSSPLRHVWVSTAYEGWAKQLIHDYKFARAQAASRTIARIMHTALPYLDRVTLVIPVPTASSRQRLRGYDQAALLAREIAKETRLHYAPLLQRMGQTRQVGADGGLRRTQLVSAYRLSHARLVPGAHILLVDDILTTGASLEATGHVLKAAGAAQIDAVVFAQKR